MIPNSSFGLKYSKQTISLPPCSLLLLAECCSIVYTDYLFFFQLVDILNGFQFLAIVKSVVINVGTLRTLEMSTFFLSFFFSR